MFIVDQLKKGDRRVQWLAAGMLLGMVVLLGGLWYVQIASSGRYQTSLRHQTYRTVRIPAIRGRIYDRNGIVLAENRPSYVLHLYLEELRPLYDKEFTRRRDGRSLSRAAYQSLRLEVRYGVASNIVQQVAAVLKTPIHLTERRFQRHHNQWPYRPLTVLENLDASQVARFLEQSRVIPGVDLDVLPVRYYPYGETAAHLLGYLTRDDLARDEGEDGFSYSLPSYDGALGLEYAYNDQLRGRAGIKSILINSLSYREAESIWVVAEPGRNLVLTLDLYLQQAAAEALSTVGPDVRGAVVILDCTQGDILALVSAPAYDPNLFVNHLSVEQWQVLNDPDQKPIFNRATYGGYHPGSTFKIVTALACFEAGVLTPRNITNLFDNPGYFRIGRRSIGDMAPSGKYDFRRAFKRSSNTYFIHHGLLAGQERLLSVGKRFFLGEPTGLGTRQEVKGYFPSPDDRRLYWGRGNVANVCIGQEITVTPLQMAGVTAAVANGGTMFHPRIVQRIEPAQPEYAGFNVKTMAPRVRGVLNIDPLFLRIVRQMMLADTEEAEGTGFRAFQQRDPSTGRTMPRIPGFRVGGKTGTAEIKRGGRVVDKTTWFVAFGPYEQPRYAVVVMVESGLSGSRTCAPVARRIFDVIKKRTELAPPTSRHLAQAE